MTTPFTPAMARRIELWPLDRLKPYERNARTHSEAQIAELAGSSARTISDVVGRSIISLQAGDSTRQRLEHVCEGLRRAADPEPTLVPDMTEVQPLPRLLVIFYAAIFLLAAFVPKEFLAVAFDSGGVTTGPMTVPFIMALGVGVSAIRSDRHAADDSFGLVALCSVGPILAVLILGIVFNASESSYVPPVIPEVGDSVELWQLFGEGLPTYLHEIALSLLPIIVMFGIFQLAEILLPDTDQILQLAQLPLNLFRLILIVPEVGTDRLPLQQFDLLALAV